MWNVSWQVIEKSNLGLFQSSLSVGLKQRSLNQEQQYYLGISWKLKFSGPTLDELNQKLWVGAQQTVLTSPLGFCWTIKFKRHFSPWLVRLSELSASLQTKGSPVQFPVRAHAWVAGQVPSWGVCERQPHIDVSPPLLLPAFLSFSLKIK